MLRFACSRKLLRGLLFVCALFCHRLAHDTDKYEGSGLGRSGAAGVTCCIHLVLNWAEFDLIYHLTRLEVLFHVVSDGYWTPVVHQLLGVQGLCSSTFCIAAVQSHINTEREFFTFEFARKYKMQYNGLIFFLCQTMNM